MQRSFFKTMVYLHLFDSPKHLFYLVGFSSSFMILNIYPRITLPCSFVHSDSINIDIFVKAVGKKQEDRREADPIIQNQG